MTAEILAKPAPAVPGPAPAAPGRTGTARRLAWLSGALLLLAVLTLAGIAVGARYIPPGQVLHVLLHREPASEDWIVVHHARIPRTLLGIAVGAALGIAGAMMQALTRNPLADPGLLGVNGGAAAAVAAGTALLDLRTFGSFVWFALAGAAVAALVVQILGGGGRASATPARLALAGTAVTAVLTAFVNGLILLDPLTLNRFRFWQVGTLAGVDSAVLGQVLPFLAAGGLLALLLGRPLNALALGDDAGHALGANPTRTRLFSLLAVTLLCGAATAAVGPIAFVGLAVPHLARHVCGPDQRWIMLLSAVLAPVLLLGSDIIGRLALHPAELQVGVVTAFIGAPLFIALVRGRRIAQL
ncbi:iron ABC transporter permease [Kitasatospora herbaricolor]|uniref:FecCD family ABC transporter permease n=1 Tax=Kitasatospora herbaricolor TaxID=68217 RepID=UPI00174C147B|nr:iron chelate uptake ABC transporter family permease subunit [Kitasatospora herbaricolor]MDQ0311363.1 iron complex transport system permease protein [Kitasatospora herbaricolor]GGV22843.1 iron ABC transporter permease [Kitasatospora herbaricolor]